MWKSLRDPSKNSKCLRQYTFVIFEKQFPINFYFTLSEIANSIRFLKKATITLCSFRDYFNFLPQVTSAPPRIGKWIDIMSRCDKMNRQIDKNLETCSRTVYYTLYRYSHLRIHDWTTEGRVEWRGLVGGLSLSSFRNDDDDDDDTTTAIRLITDKQLRRALSRYSGGLIEAYAPSIHSRNVWTGFELRHKS